MKGPNGAIHDDIPLRAPDTAWRPRHLTKAGHAEIMKKGHEPGMKRRHAGLLQNGSEEHRARFRKEDMDFMLNWAAGVSAVLGMNPSQVFFAAFAYRSAISYTEPTGTAYPNLVAGGGKAARPFTRKDCRLRGPRRRLFLGTGRGGGSQDRCRVASTRI